MSHDYRDATSKRRTVWPFHCGMPQRHAVTAHLPIVWSCLYLALLHIERKKIKGSSQAHGASLHTQYDRNTQVPYAVIYAPLVKASLRAQRRNILAPPWQFKVSSLIQRGTSPVLIQRWKQHYEFLVHPILQLRFASGSSCRPFDAWIAGSALLLGPLSRRTIY